MRLRQTARKRRRLPIGATARHLELLFQSLVFAPQPIALDLRAQQIFAEAFILASQVVDGLRATRRRIRRIGCAPRHERVMPERRTKYKQELRSAER